MGLSPAAVLLYAALFTLGATLVGWALRAILHQLRIIADRLDPDTPGGLRDVIDHLDEQAGDGN